MRRQRAVFNPGDTTFEGRVLARLPAIRSAVRASAEFADWRDSLASLVVDGELLYLRGGDMLKDEDQIMFEWARRKGLLSDALIAQAEALEDGGI